jgi:hypothetical protein
MQSNPPEAVLAYILDDIVNGIGSWFAGDAQKKEAQKAMDLQRDIFGQQQHNWDQTRADQMPWLQAGQSSLADLLKMTQGGYDPSAIANDPGFQFRMAEGQKALERSAAARGGLNSGGFMKGLARYSQGLASDEFQNRFNRLNTIAGMGQNSAQNLGGLSGQNSAQMGQYANSMSDLYGAMGNAKSAQIMGLTNGVTGGMRSLGNLAMNGGLPGQQGFGDFWNPGRIPGQRG